MSHAGELFCPLCGEKEFELDIVKINTTGGDAFAHAMFGKEFRVATCRNCRLKLFFDDEECEHPFKFIQNAPLGHTPRTFLKRCKNCGQNIPIASEVCPKCDAKQPRGR